MNNGHLRICFDIVYSGAMEKERFQTDSFGLKVIAIIAMTANHFAHVFHGHLPSIVYTICIGVGGMTFPIMAFQIAEGYKYTRDVKKYALRLAVFTIASFLPFYLVLGEQLNVIATLLLGLLVIWADDASQGNSNKRLAFYLFFIAAIVATHWCDWSYVGVPMIYLYHRGQGKKWQVVAPATLVWMMGATFVLDFITRGSYAYYLPYYLPSFLYFFVGVSATIPLLLAYRGKQGRKMKYFFYIYYPLHIVALGLLERIIYG